MREERAAAEVVGGRGALCAGVDDAAADVVAFITRFSIAVNGVNQTGVRHRFRQSFPHLLPFWIFKSYKLSNAETDVMSTRYNPI